jgi:hypothetical protein
VLRDVDKVWRSEGEHVVSGSRVRWGVSVAW